MSLSESGRQGVRCYCLKVEGRASGVTVLRWKAGRQVSLSESGRQCDRCHCLKMANRVSGVTV